MNRDRDEAEIFNAFFASSILLTDQEGFSALSWRTMTGNDQLPGDPELVGLQLYGA